MKERVRNKSCPPRVETDNLGRGEICGRQFFYMRGGGTLPTPSEEGNYEILIDSAK